MCEVLDRAEAKGKLEGKLEGKISVYYYELNMSPEEISKKLSISVDKVENILSEMDS